MQYAYDIRKFEAYNTIPELLFAIKDYYQEGHPVVMSKIKHQEDKASYHRLFSDVHYVCKMLDNLHSGVMRVALMSEFFCYEWLVAFLAVICTGNIAVPIDKDLNESALLQHMQQADINAVFFDNSCSRNISSDLSAGLLFTISLDRSNGYPSIKDFCGSELIKYTPKQTLSPDQSAIMIFTSGTMGASKIVSLSHKNICHDIFCSISLLGERAVFPGDRTIPVLPLHHVYGITVGILAPLCYGMTLCAGGGMKYFSKSIAYFKPTFLTIVPIIAEAIHKRIWQETERNGKTKRLKTMILFNHFFKRFGLDMSGKLFRKVWDSLGGNLKILLCGAAFVEKNLVDAYSDLGISLIVGYGISECSPLITANALKNNVAGSVGKTVGAPYCEIKIMNGEICVKGSIVFSEYYKNEQETQKAFTNGWFKTGDLGYLDSNGNLYISGRKKNLIILPDGNNVSPEELESLLQKESLIKSVFVCEREYENCAYITAYIHPNYEYASSLKMQDIRGEILKIVSKINLTLPYYKKIHKVEISETDFEKTALGKVKRYVYCQ